MSQICAWWSICSHCLTTHPTCSLSPASSQNIPSFLLMWHWCFSLSRILFLFLLLFFSFAWLTSHLLGLSLDATSQEALLSTPSLPHQTQLCSPLMLLSAVSLWNIIHNYNHVIMNLTMIMCLSPSTINYNFHWEGIVSIRASLSPRKWLGS